MTAIIAQADACRLPLADQSVDLVFTSPPYVDARTYGIAAQRDCAEWVQWMLGVLKELTRVCRGLVLVNCAGVTRGRVYQPAPEGLAREWWKAGGNLWRPAYWHRVGIPGSGGRQWLRADVEYVWPFKRDREWPTWADNTACGEPPRYGPGGAMSHRMTNGVRVNGRMVYRKISTDGYKNGDTLVKPIDYCPPDRANPGNLIKTKVGGGRMGHPLAHENEAPFPEALAEFFVKSFCPPGGLVLDPFGGSGTTAAVALRLGRRAVTLDLRMGQCELTRRRLTTPARAARPKPRPENPAQLCLPGLEAHT